MKKYALSFYINGFFSLLSSLFLPCYFKDRISSTPPGGALLAKIFTVVLCNTYTFGNIILTAIPIEKGMTFLNPKLDLKYSSYNSKIFEKLPNFSGY